MTNVNTPAANAANPSTNLRLPTVCTAWFHTDPWPIAYRGVMFEFVLSLDFSNTVDYCPHPEFYLVIGDTKVLVDMPYDDDEFNALVMAHTMAENAVDETVSDELNAYLLELFDACIVEHFVPADAAVNAEGYVEVDALNASVSAEASKGVESEELRAASNALLAALGADLLPATESVK